MNTLPRLLSAAAIAVATLALPASAQTTLRMATQMPSDSPEGRVHERFAELVDEYTDGSVEIVIYPNDQLGKLDAVLEQLKMGTVQIFAEGMSFMKKWVPELNWVASPFVFENRDHWVRFVKSPLVGGWLETAADEAGVVVVGSGTEIERGPFRVIVSKRPVETVEDLEGLGLRLFSNKTQIDAWTYLGASTKVIPWTDVYSSMQTGLVEATTSPISLIESMRFYEQAKNITRTDEYFQSVAYMVNKRAWEGLTDEERAAIEKAHAEAGEYSKAVLEELASGMIGSLEGRGVAYVEPDMGPFVEKLSGFYDDMATAGELPEGFLDAVNETRAAQ